MKFSLVLLFSTIATLSFSQNLLPSIGLSSAPQPNDPICWFPVTIDPDGTFQTQGPQVGDTAADFTLYDMANNPVTLSSELQNGKYVLLVSGSYTCPVFRNKVSEINNIAQAYGADVSTFVIYELEAHPDVDTSIFFGFPNPGAQNINDGILYQQPTTYQERMDIVTDMNNDLTITAPILLDGPCNEYLSYYGVAPNNAYIIDTNGVIVVKHGWFDKLPLDMSADIDSLLGLGGGSVGDNGTFTFALNGDSADYDNPGNTLSVYGTFTNLSATDNVVIDILRSENNLPDSTWSSAMCIDACLGTNVSQYTLYIPPSGTQSFTFYFFNNSAAAGDALLEFTNVYDPINQVIQRFYGYTDGTTDIKEPESLTAVALFPNPARDNLNVHIDGDLGRYYMHVIDINGRVIDNISLNNGTNTVSLNRMASGLYMYNLYSEEGYLHSGKFIKE